MTVNETSKGTKKAADLNISVDLSGFSHFIWWSVGVITSIRVCLDITDFYDFSGIKCGIRSFFGCFINI
uniref:hypothetical protein n=1 Tax=Mobilibacterium timonense TaxID=1871012 RepID=UPI0019682132